MSLCPSRGNAFSGQQVDTLPCSAGRHDIVFVLNKEIRLPVQQADECSRPTGRQVALINAKACL